MFVFTNEELQRFDLNEIGAFIDFWVKFYDDKKYSPNRYYENLNLGNDLTDKNMEELLKWKDIQHFTDTKIKKVIEKIDSINQFRKNEISKTDFEKDTDLFTSGAGIWNIFIRHIANPLDYPLYDQHVFRAYCYHKNEKEKNIKTKYEDYKEYFFKYIEIIMGTKK